MELFYIKISLPVASLIIAKSFMAAMLKIKELLDYLEQMKID